MIELNIEAKPKVSIPPASYWFPLAKRLHYLGVEVTIATRIAIRCQPQRLAVGEAQALDVCGILMNGFIWEQQPEGIDFWEKNYILAEKGKLVNITCP